MPIFSYFAVAGSVLLGLLLLSDAMLPARGTMSADTMSAGTEFRGLTATRQSKAPAPARAAGAPALVPAPDMKSEGVRLASEGVPRAAELPNIKPVNEPVTKAEPAPKKRKHVARPREWRDQYAQSNDFGWNWDANNRFNDNRFNDRRRRSDRGFDDRGWWNGR